MKKFQEPKQPWSERRDWFGAAVAETQSCKKRKEPREKSCKNKWINKAYSFKYKQKSQSWVVGLRVWAQVGVEGGGSRRCFSSLSWGGCGLERCYPLEEGRAGSGLWPVVALSVSRAIHSHRWGLDKRGCLEIDLSDQQNLRYQWASRSAAWPCPVYF